jgi:hypothetical protein
LAITVVASLSHLHLMHCTIRLIAHIWLIYPLGHMYAKSELEVQAEQAQVEAITNLSLDQGKPWCINQCSLSFILNLALCSLLIMH